MKSDPTKIIGSGQVQDEAMVAVTDLIANVNDLFEGDLTPGVNLMYVNDVIKGKLMESVKLTKQALNKTKEQFDHSPDRDKERKRHHGCVVGTQRDEQAGTEIGGATGRPKSRAT